MLFIRRAGEVKLFLAAIVFCVIGLQLHSCEVHTKKSLARISYVKLSPYEPLEMRFLIPNPSTIRLTAMIMEDLNNQTHHIRSAIEFQLISEGEVVLKGIRSPFGSSGGTRRKNISSSYWNYGLFRVEAPGDYIMKVTPNPEIRKLKSYHLRIHADATDAKMSFFRNMSLIFLLISFLLKEYRAFHVEIKHGFKFVYFFFASILVFLNVGL